MNDQGSDNKAPRIRAFPEGQDLWRIDWFGLIAFPDRRLQARHPSVLVALSLVVAPDALEHPSVLLQPDATLSRRQIKRWVSVGTMMLLRIGDLWRDQRLVVSPPYQTETFDDLKVGRDTSELIKAGLSLEDGAFLLPLSEHPWHSQNTHSYCLRVKLADGRSIVVPCMELIRFYFGSSAALLTRLFDPDLTKDRLFSEVVFNPRNKWMRINLAEGLPKASASDVARIAGSHTAWRAAALVLTSCLKASAAHQDIYPQAVFPFEGTTNLTAVGKWLWLGNKPNQTFIVYRLETCTHAFPFSSLTFKVSGDKHRQRRPATQEAPPAEPKPRVVKKTEAAATPGLVEQDASNTLAAAEVPMWSNRHFPDLARKRLIGHRNLTKSGEVRAPGKPAPPINDMAVGEPGSSKRVRRIMLAEADRSQAPRLPDFLKPVVDAIDGLNGFESSLLTASDDDGWTVPIELLSDDDGVIADELFVDHSGRQQQRRAAAFGLCHAGEHVVLVMVEADPLIPLVYPVDAAGLDDPWPAIRCAAQDFVAKVGRPERADVVVDVHTSSDASGAISDWIRELWG